MQHLKSALAQTLSMKYCFEFVNLCSKYGLLQLLLDIDWHQVFGLGLFPWFYSGLQHILERSPESSIVLSYGNVTRYLVVKRTAGRTNAGTKRSHQKGSFALP